MQLAIRILLMRDEVGKRMNEVEEVAFVSSGEYPTQWWISKSHGAELYG